MAMNNCRRSRGKELFGRIQMEIVRFMIQK